MEGVHDHPLLLLLLTVVLSLFHSYADAQGSTISNPPLGITLRDNLKATLSVILLGFFSAFVFMFFFRLYLRHCSNGYRAGNNAIAAAVDLCGGRFNRQVIDKCPVLLYSKVKELRVGKGALECAVCLSEFQECDKIRLLPKCHHVFHPDCIDAWLLAHMSCPVCRAKLTYSDTLLHVAIPVIPTETECQFHGQSSSGSAAPKPRGLGRFPRSHSTGHSIVGPEEEVENDRYPLRLAMPREWCVWKGERCSASLSLSLPTTPLAVSFNGSSSHSRFVSALHY